MLTLIGRIDETIGGIVSGELCEVVGETSTGKTQFCLSLLVNATMGLNLPTDDTNIRGVYIDTSNSFHPERVAQIFMNHKNGNSKSEVYMSPGFLI